MSDKTKELIKTAEAMNQDGMLREIAEAIDETLDQHAELEEPCLQAYPGYSREARLVLGNQITILKSLQYLLTKVVASRG